MSEPRVSVIMPCYNRTSFLEDAARSVLSQSHRNIELIAVDDGSTDATAELLAGMGCGDARIRLCRIAHGGPYVARNHGLRQMTGKAVMFLDSDDFLRSDALEVMLRLLTTAGADVVLSAWADVRSDGAVIRECQPPQSREAAWRELMDGWCWPIHAALVATPVLRSLGGFSVTYQTSMDSDLWLRLASTGARFSSTNQVLAFYRWHHEGQISIDQRSAQRAHAEEIRARYMKGPAIL